MAEAATEVQISTVVQPDLQPSDEPVSPTASTISNTLSGNSNNAVAARKRTPSDFEFGRVLGEGSFGQVIEAVEKETGKKYAIKILDKRYVIKHKKTKYVQTEKEIMNMLDHPNVVKLYYTFQDPDKLCMYSIICILWCYV